VKHVNTTKMSYILSFVLNSEFGLNSAFSLNSEFGLNSAFSLNS